jgi:hypothetical protein
MSFFALVVDDEPDVEMLFRQQFRRDLRDNRKRGRGPAVRGKRVCRMHGAGGGAPAGKRNGNYRQGTSTKEAIYLMRDLNMLARLLKRLPR